MTPEEAAAVNKLAHQQGWDEMTVLKLRIMLWAMKKYIEMPREEKAT